MGSESQPTASYLEQICTNVNNGFEYGKEVLCKLTDNTAEGAKYVVDKLYGSDQDASQTTATKGGELLSNAVEEIKKKTSNVAAETKNLTYGAFGISAANDSQSNSDQPKAVESNNKCNGAVSTGIKVVAAVLVVAGVAQAAHFCYQWRKKSLSKK